MNEDNALTLKNKLHNSNIKTRILSGMDGLIAAAEYDKSQNCRNCSVRDDRLKTNRCSN